MILHVGLILFGVFLGGGIVCLLTANKEAEFEAEIARRERYLHRITKATRRWFEMVGDPNFREYDRHVLESETLDNIYATLCEWGREESQ